MIDSWFNIDDMFFVVDLPFTALQALSFQLNVLLTFIALEKKEISMQYVNKSIIPSGITKGHHFVHQKVHRR